MPMLPHFSKMLAFTLGLAAFAGRATASYDLCGQKYENEAAAKADASSRATDFVRRMKIAKAQGDLFGMNDLYAGYFKAYAAQCDGKQPPKAEFRLVCGLDCHVQLAEYHLFEANDIEYYATKASTAGDPTSALLKPEQMAKHVLEGLAIVESAVTLMDSTPSASAPGSDLRDYVQVIGNLNLLKAKLFMAAGDAWYKAVSEKRVQRLAHLVSTSVDLDPTSPPPGFPAGGSMLQEAAANYDAALWGLNEALLEIPDEHYFDALTLEAKQLLGELKKRRVSLQQGLIFVGIDPDDSTPVSIAYLKDRLGKAATRAAVLEEKVESAVKTFFARSSEIEASNVNNTQALASQSLGLSSYKIASLETEADQEKTVLEGKINALSGAHDTYEMEYRRAELVFTLNRQVAEAQNRLDRLEGTQEVDALTFQSNQVAQRINQLQWLMNQDVSRTNLELQVDSLKSTLLTMSRDVEKSTYTLQQLALRIDSARSGIGDAERDIDNNHDEIKTLQARQGPIFQQSQRAAAAAICEVEAKLKRLKGAEALQPLTEFKWTDESGAAKTCDTFFASGSSPVDPDLGTEGAYIQKRCEMKHQLEQSQVRTTADALGCVVGVDQLPQSVKASLDTYLRNQQPSQTLDSYVTTNCQSIKDACTTSAGGAKCDTVYQSARKAYGERLTLVQKRVDALKDLIDALKTDRNWMIAQVGFQSAAHLLDSAAWIAQLSALSAAKTATEKIPRVEVGTVGPFPVTLDTSLWRIPQDQANSALQTAKDLHEAALQAESWTQFIFTSAQKIRDLDQQVKNAEASFDQAKVSQELQKYETGQALMEMTGRSLDLGEKLVAILAQTEETSLDCSNQNSALNSQVAQLQLQHESLISQAATARQENDLLTLGIQRAQRLIQSDVASIQRLSGQIDELTLEQKKVQLDIDTIQGKNGLLARTQKQIDKISALLDRLAAKQSEVEAKQAVQATLLSEIFKKTTALNNDDIAYVQGVIGQTSSHTKKMIAAIGKIEGVDQEMTGLKSAINAKYTEMLNAVMVERKNMLQTAEGAYEGTKANPLEAIYLTNEEMVATLTLGVPHFLQEKRRLMESANFELGLLYARARALTSAVDSNTGFGLGNDTEPLAYARTAEDIVTALDNTDNDMLKKQAIVQAEVIRIEIPFTSGLGRQLQTDHVAEFEISPTAAGRMEELGHYALWHPVLSEANGCTVLDMRLSIEPKGSNCMMRKVSLEHKGFGFRFVGVPGGTAEPQLFAGAAKEARVNYLSANNDGDFQKAWLSSEMSLLGFWNGQVNIPYDPEGLLPFLGLPVIGTYRVSLPDLYSTSGQTLCSYDDSRITLYIAYAKASQR